jgi:1-acyl-sn-glycerol-3-phosphate acyltransferase
MKAASHVLGPLIRAILCAVCKVDAAELNRLPRTGPLIIVTNHINFLEAPLLYSLLYPHDISGFAKSDTWRNPLLGLLATIWECVPVERGSNDMSSMRLALEALGRGKMLNVMPEGTRSHDGMLGPGHAGVVAMALRSGAPIVPVAIYGSEAFWPSLRRGRRTSVHFRVGAAYRIRQPEPGAAKSSRAEATDEIMQSLAMLLPPEYRGVYAGRRATSRQLIPVKANL